MKQTEKKYRKLCSYRSMVAGIKVFDGGNHFLFAIGSGYSEEYFRFFFSDIQAIKLVEKKFFYLWISIGAALTAILILLGIIGSMLFLLIPGGIFVLLLLLYAWKGPMMRIAFMTPLGDQEYSFCRRRKALRVYRVMCGLVSEAQEVVEPSEVVSEIIETERTIVI